MEKPAHFCVEINIDGTRIRVNGINAPEFAQSCGNWRCGENALEVLDRLIHSGLGVQSRHLVDSIYRQRYNQRLQLFSQFIITHIFYR
jgi:endonuclease YncB( thermonuclease family)